MSTTLAKGFRTTDQPVLQMTVAEYHRLQDMGFLDTRGRCELIRGLIVEIPPMKPPHASTTDKLHEALRVFEQDDLRARCQRPITMRDSEPIPDLILVSGDLNAFDRRHPKPSEIRLLIEVSDSTLRVDRTIKMELYASERIEQYWIVNIQDCQIEVYTLPRGGRQPRYLASKEYRAGSRIPVIINGVQVGEIAVNKVLPT